MIIRDTVDLERQIMRLGAQASEDQPMRRDSLIAQARALAIRRATGLQQDMQAILNMRDDWKGEQTQQRREVTWLMRIGHPKREGLLADSQGAAASSCLAPSFHCLVAL
jgi:hypothetical protein